MAKKEEILEQEQVQEENPYIIELTIALFVLPVILFIVIYMVKNVKKLINTKNNLYELNILNPK